MRATELVGKIAIRTGPDKIGDYSYTDHPVKILKATDDHIIIEYIGSEARIFNSEPHLLNCAFCDDKWIDAEEIFGILTGKVKVENPAPEPTPSATVIKDENIEVPEPWCYWQLTTQDFPNELSCTAHLHDGRCFKCPYNKLEDRDNAQYPCQDYKPLEDEQSPMQQVQTPQIPENKAQISFWKRLFGKR